MEESHQIGFTQNYARLAPVVVGGAIGGAIGGVVAVTTVSQSDYTRIVIPFGRLFEEQFQAGLKQAFPNSAVNSKGAATADTQAEVGAGHAVSLEVKEFQVWEEPPNHLNLRAVIICRVLPSRNTNGAGYSFETRQELTKQSIGSIMSTSTGFVHEMNKISDAFAASLSDEILGKLQKHFGE